MTTTSPVADVPASGRATPRQASAAILGQPNQLFVLFFTEMWERFSYYGMRGLLVLFLVTEAAKGGWGWTRAEATTLYGWYTMGAYLLPVLGGYLADRFLGTRRAVVVGGFVIAAGHVSMFLNTVPSFYIGLGLVVVGTGLFKPNVSAVVGQLYGPKEDNARDGGYTLFYMGVNAGAFFGILLCGYIGEKLSWHLGFGLAGLFMILGALQFYFSQHIFGDIGAPPAVATPLAQVLKAWAIFILGFVWPPTLFRRIINFLVTVWRFLVGDGEENGRLKAIFVFSFFTIFFWFAFEQAGGSMTIFAADYTDRTLAGTSGFAFKVVNSLMTVLPALILTWLLWKLNRSTGSRYLLANGLLALAFAVIWGLVLWMLGREFALEQSEVPATWFGVLNSFFLVILAPMFSKMWEKHWNPAGSVKFGVGLVLLGLGFAALSYGSAGIPQGAKTAQVSMIYLTLAYLLHTMGELCLSPVGLSYISKLAPARLLGLMFGVWFLNTAFANKLAGVTGSYIDEISNHYSMSIFFLIFTAIPIGAGLVLMLLAPWMKKKMHGVH
ncbi:peptide MFS transporter [Pelomonas aquatica]|uniref:peptide MFS transporter n=1 Tax=Pelomonas aquatica TaxID=431058 RepID=UPI00227BF8DC|nr:peptide MFS transporter [Pelomonas aquatica]MCY4752967.1 peptide MFS transporter [Pelomonas aquatica]